MFTSIRNYRLLIVGGAFLLGSCQSQALDVSCLPEEARAWVASGNDKAKPECTDADATVYFDRSQSMLGFIIGARPALSRNDEHVLGDVAAMMREAAACEGGTVTYKGFGSGAPQTLDGRAPDQAGTAAFYPAGIGASTQLGILFSEIADSDGASLVITDLWRGVPQKEQTTSGAVSLSVPLRKIFESGRSVAIYGFNAPFAGHISDVPGARSFPMVGEHPFYLIAVGSAAHLERTRQRLEASTAEFIREGLAGGSGKVRYTLFSPSSVPKQPLSATPFKPGRGQGLQLANKVELAPGVRIQQFIFDQDDARKAELKHRQGGQPAVWKAPAVDASLKGSVWGGATMATEHVWSRIGTACKVSGWTKEQEIGSWKPSATAAQQYALEGGALLDGFEQKGTYLLSGEIAPSFDGNDTPDAATWMTDWSLSAQQARLLSESVSSGQRPGVQGSVGTLFLADTARILQTSLAEAARRKPQPIAGFTILVTVR